MQFCDERYEKHVVCAMRLQACSGILLLRLCCDDNGTLYYASVHEQAAVPFTIAHASAVAQHTLQSQHWCAYCALYGDCSLAALTQVVTTHTVCTRYNYCALCASSCCNRSCTMYLNAYLR
jgi:hypothetical protein